MSKRPSLIGGLNLPGADASRGGAAAIEDTAASAPEPMAAGRRARPEVVHTSVYLPRPVHRKLREIAFTRDVKVHDLLMEGVDEVLRKNGHPSVAALKDGGKAGG